MRSIGTDLVYPTVGRKGGAYPLQFWGSNIWLAVVPATSLPQNPRDVMHGSQPTCRASQSECLYFGFVE